MRNPAAYGASKAALESLGRYLSATSEGRIRANSVAAGGILRGQGVSFVDKYSSRAPIGRMATEDDILRVITFLLGDESRYIFGQTLVADGGFSIW
jgi:NAD(P)-dependent dehydrogenase (short-subunit alcohol dehydrogenase family)